MRLLMIGLICLFCPQILIAGLPETPQFRQLTVADGLPSSTMYGVTQDRDGYIWLASKDGLARYDGIDFKYFRYSPGDDNALPGNVVQVLHVDRDNQLWIAVEGQGLLRMNPQRNQIKTYKKSTHPAMGSDDIWAINSDKAGNIWFGTFGGGLYRLDRNGKITRIVLSNVDENGVPTDTVLDIAIDAKQQVWVATTNGLYRWDGKRSYRVDDAALPNPFVVHLVVNADGTIWVGTRKGLQLINQMGLAIGKPLLTGQAISALSLDKEGSLWVTSGSIVYRWKERELAKYELKEFGNIAFTSIFYDGNGSIWFCTQDNGLLRIPANWKDFFVSKHSDINADTISGEIVRSVSYSKKHKVFLVSMNGGLDELDLVNGKVDRILVGTKSWSQAIWSVFQSTERQIWIGHRNGLSRYSPSTKQLNHYSGADYLEGSVRLITQTPDGLIWSASYGGGIQARRPDGQVVHTVLAKEGSAFSSPDPDQFSISPQAELWVATSTGLIRWDAVSQSFVAIPGSPKERVDAFTFVGTDTVWLHYMGVLMRMQWDGKVLREMHRVGTDAGLPAVEVGTILPDKNGNLWLSTIRGLLHYRVQSDLLRTFGVRDGLPSQEFDMQPGLVTPEGLMLMGTQKGLVVFDPSLIRQETSQANLVLDEIDLRRGEDIIPLMPQTREIQLEAGDRDLRIRTRLLAFADAQSHRYRFYMKGFDADWVDVGARGERIFSNLPAGEFVLEVKAAAVDGQWSKPLQIKIKVQPPWWQSVWAYCLWAFLVLLLFFTVATWYRRRLKQRHAQRLLEQERLIERQSSQAKSEFLATLGHEIRTPMTGVMGMTELLQASELNAQQRHRVQSIQTAGQHLLRLVNDALDIARIEAGKLSLEVVEFDVHKLIDEVGAMLKPLAELKGLQFSCICESSTPKFCNGDADRIRQILLNLGNNAIKFTESGKIQIRSFSLMPSGIRVQVSDTGPGISDEQQLRLFKRFEQAEGRTTTMRYGGSGLGLAICQELAIAMSGLIDIKSALGEGASFTVSLPLTQTLGLDIANKKHQMTTVLTPKRLLLVEDDPMVAEVIQALLMSKGHQVTHVSQGLQALTELSLKKFDAALLDLDLPGINGIELAEMILSQNPDLPIIAVTARADAAAEPQVKAAGMLGFVRKPVSSDTLVKALRDVM
jgi:signal transduction histidine kinase/ligand-binding sensor domain-containing protein/CheY-like chemotaxis protein